MLRVLIGLTIALAVLAGPAHAQKKRGPPPPTPEELDKKRQDEALDKQYKSTLQRMNMDAAPVRVDPWADVRGPAPTKR